jgi:hypothetical protein
MKVLSSSRQTAGSSNDLAGAEEDLPPTDVDEKLESEIVAIRSEVSQASRGHTRREFKELLVLAGSPACKHVGSTTEGVSVPGLSC